MPMSVEEGNCDLEKLSGSLDLMLINSVTLQPALGFLVQDSLFGMRIA